MKKKKLEELNRLGVEDFKLVAKIPITIVLDNIRSLNNIGSVFRTADAFRVEEIILCGISAKPPHRDITKTALGATESVNWRYVKDTMEVCKEFTLKGYDLIAIEQAEGAISLSDWKWTSDSKFAIFFGHEVTGVSDQVMQTVNHCVEIPQFGTKHSFNISVSVGMILWDAYSKQYHQLLK